MTVDQQRMFEARKVELSKEQGFELKFTTQVASNPSRSSRGKS